MITGKVTKVLGNSEYEFEYKGKLYIQNLEIAAEHYREYKVGDEFEMNILCFEASTPVDSSTRSEI